jgi:hypothetical protein
MSACSATAAGAFLALALCGLSMPILNMGKAYHDPWLFLRRLSLREMATFMVSVRHPDCSAEGIFEKQHIDR